MRPQLTVLGPAEVESEVSGSEGRVPRTGGHPTGPCCRAASRGWQDETALYLANWMRSLSPHISSERIT